MNRLMNFFGCNRAFFIAISALSLIGLPSAIHAQTTIIDPTTNGGFEVGSTFAANGWSNNSSQTNQWVCNTGATPGFGGVNAAYISNNPTSATPPHQYTNTTTSTSHIYRDIAIPAGETFIQLSFDWIGLGESCCDYMRVWLVPTSYTPFSGTQITAVTGVRTRIGLTSYRGQNIWNRETITINPSYAGTSFRLVFEWRNDGSTGGNPPAGLDNISLTSVAPIPPPNDGCANATPVVINNDNLCSATTSGSLTFATASGVSNCTTGNPNDDVWFSFVATSSAHTISLFNITGNYTDLVHAVYSNSCGSLSLVSGSCSNPNNNLVTGLTIGQTYLVQVYSFANSSTLSQQPAIIDFEICVGLPPLNDNPCNATVLDVSGNCNVSYGNTLFATDSNVSNPSCNTSGDDDDIWFSFVAQETSHSINIENVAGSTTDLFHIVYQGSCNSLTSMICSDPNNSTVTGLTIGNTYYVQVFTYSSGNYNSSFDICTIPVVSPCSNLSSLPELACSTPETVLISGGTGFIDSNPCGSWDLEGQEALFIFTPSATADYSITQISTSGSGDDSHINYLYKEVIDGCNDNNWNCMGHLVGNDQSGSTAMLTAGVTYYILLDTETTASNNVTFQISCPPECGDSFYDSGGISGNYLNNEIRSITICPDSAGSYVTVNFSSFQVEGAGANNCFDSLRIYDGPNTSSTQITPASLGLGTGTDGFCYESPTDGTANLTGQSITATNIDGCLTFVFTSDVSTTLSGWEADIMCSNVCITWNGSQSTDWDTTTNWTPNQVPTSLDCIIIPDASTTANDPIIYGTVNGNALNLTIEDNGNLLIESNGTLTLQDHVDIQGSGIFQINDSGSLIQVNDVPSSPNSGNISMNREAYIRRLDYVYWSSPVADFSVGNISPATPSSHIYEWISTIPTGTSTPEGIPICFGDWNVASGVMANGRGYIVRGPDSFSDAPSNYTAVFNGVANNGEITRALNSGNNTSTNSTFYYNPYGNDLLTVTPFDDNWNLIGNPYPSALDAEAFLSYDNGVTNNSLIEGAIHIWTHASAIGTYSDSFYDDFVLNYNVSDYVTYNKVGSNMYPQTFDGQIAAGQGFFVLALNDNETGSVTFNNSMRQLSANYDNSQFFRQATASENSNTSSSIEKHRIWLNLIAPSQMASSTLIGYVENATLEKDRLYDAYTMEANALNLYSKINEDRMVIQGRPVPFDQNDQVPLGAVISETGLHSITISGIDGLFLDENQDIFLEDTYLNVIHNIKVSPYSFVVEAPATFDDRFILRYTDETLGISDYDYNNEISIIAPKGEYIKITSGDGDIKNVVVYDMLGRILIDKKDLNASEVILDRLNLSKGTYIVKIELYSHKQKSQKVVLKT